MATITVKWSASENLLRQEILADGKAGHRERNFAVEMADLTPDQRGQIIEWGMVEYTGKGDVYVKPLDLTSEVAIADPQSDYDGFRYRNRPIHLDAQPSLADALRLYAEKLAREEAINDDRRALSQRKAQSAEKRKQEEAENERRNAEERERREAAKAQAEADKLAWCKAHGSNHLRTAVENGYDCARLYATERAAVEHPGFTLDFDNAAEWKSRSCPSPEALSIALGVEGEVVWLTAPAKNEEPSAEDYGYWADEYEPCEAVVIRNFLGKYDLVRTF